MGLDKNLVIKEAQKYAAKGQFDKAIAEWKKIAKESPHDANVFNNIGDLCLKKNSKPEAVDAYKKAADILAADGFSSKAIALYKKVLNIDPKKIEAHLALADLNAEKGLTGNALESYKLVADHYTRNKETAKALSIYQKMADLNASNVSFRLKLADMYVKEGMHEEAIKAFLLAANVHIAKDAFNEARQIFEKALALDPNNKDVFYKAGLVYFKEGKFAEACKTLKPAFESDPDNAEIADLYLDALAKADRTAEAQDVYRKLLSQQPDRTDLRQKLYGLYLQQKKYDEAFSEVSSLANQKIENKDLDAAEELLKAFTAEAPKHVDGKRALSALYKTVGKTSEAATTLVQAAEILHGDGDADGAKDLVFKALELVPDHVRAKHLLDALDGPAIKPSKEQAPAAESAPAQPVAPVPEAAPHLASGEDPAIVAMINEVEVLVKYGLATKALEQLETLAKKFPDSIQIRIKLRDLYGDQGNMGKAIVHMLVLADLYTAEGMTGHAEAVLRAALDMDRNNAEIRARLGLGSPAPEETRTEEPLETGFLQNSVPPLDQPFEERSPAMGEIGQEISFPEGDGAVLEEPVQLQAHEEITFDQPFTVPDAPEQEPQFTTQDVPGLQQAGAEPFLEPAAGGLSQEPPEVRRMDISEIWAEAEFYYQQGLFDEARKHYQKILELEPGNRAARSRIDEIGKEQENVQEFSKLAEAVDGLERYAGTDQAGKELATSESDEEAVRLLMQEIAQLKQKSAPAAPAFGGSGRQPASPKKGGSKDDFLDLGAELNEAANAGADAEWQASGPGDFFDLAAELREELTGVSIPATSSGSGEEQSLDDIFEEFKKGVEQQTITEDTDTHYNLGIAYKEMGLLDDAISEFVMTPEGEPKFIQSRYMLGLCYMEKGDYQNAITEIEQALALAENRGQADDWLSMTYDLGLAYQGAGNSNSALAEFQKVYDADRGYRDAGNKIKELQGGEEISLEQLKDDIEREISSKFLEEGERIEREEKTRKNEKVRK